MIKISYHGTYRDEIDPDERDDPAKESSERARDQLEDHKKIIDLHFEGIDSSNPVIVEPCMYTVRNHTKNKTKIV